jgi:hypothetical protein
MVHRKSARKINPHEGEEQAMRTLIIAAVATLMGSAALAQSAPAPAGNSNMGSQNPAVTIKPKGSPESTGSVEPGANSFTEGQARSRIEAQGFRDISGLAKDDQGFWRGKAMKDGKSMSVMLDYRGNVSTQ